MTGSNEVRWVDNHCHFGDDVDLTLAAAATVGVRKMIDVACDVEGSRRCIERSRSHNSVYATAGVHPHEAAGGIAGLEDLIASGDVIAVGECGFDFHYDHSPRRAQRDVFAAQVALANKHELPLVIHTREAWDETFDVLESQGVPKHTIFHCFTGGIDEAQACVELGAWLSFSGIVSFKSASNVQEAAAWCPVGRLLVETDSPYLAPVPHRGKTNQPAWVAAVGAALADVRGVSMADIAMATWANAHNAYPGLHDD